MMLKKAILLAFLFCLQWNVAFAGAWTQGTGTGLFIQNFSYYSANKFFDNSGHKQPLNHYSKYELNPYLEYGLRDWLTIGANIFADRTSQSNNSNWGIGDSEFFVRSRVWNENAFVFSLQPTIKLPSLDKRSERPQIGNRNFDTGLTLSGGYGFKAWNLDHFVNLDVGYNHRSGTPNDQIKFAATSGFSLSKEYMLLTQIFTTIRTKKSANSPFTLSSGDDYNLSKLQISAVYKIDEKLSLQLGAFADIFGRNTGSGSGTLFAVNKAF